MAKLELLKKYVAVQAEDEALWFQAEQITEAYLQRELRRLAWLIEEATDAQIEEAIAKYND
jgi:hypothetical protein